MGSLSDAEGRQPHPRGRRVAFFGGSFDPPHLGHLGVARAAQAALSLDSVLFAPVGTQPLKPQGTEASFEDRLAMTRMAIASEPGFDLSMADAPQPSGAPNYTLETLLALRYQLPPNTTLFCLMGADSFAGFRRWHRAAEIPFVAPLIIASRPGQLLNNLDSALPDGLTMEPAPESEIVEPAIALRRYILRNPAGQQAPFYLLPGLHIDISASDIREQIRLFGPSPAATQTPHPNLLPPPVLEYIRAHHLYH
jgi:nicotinate-nucleotide adenylyltransferase